MWSKLYLSACGAALLGFVVAITSCEAKALPSHTTPVQLGAFDESPELYDWQLVLFFHDKQTPGDDGKVKRFIRAFNHDTKEECEVGRLSVLAIEPPPNIAPDGAVCVPLKKVEFSPTAPNSVPKLLDEKLNINKVKLPIACVKVTFTEGEGL